MLQQDSLIDAATASDSASTPTASMALSDGAYLAALRAAAEETRLRLLVLGATGEWTVSDLVHIVGQSQPRISRHLKVLCDAGLLDRFREGSWVFYRLTLAEPVRALARALVAMAPRAEAPFTTDAARATEVKAARAAEAERYFAANAAEWDRIRALYIDEAEVERVLADLLGHHDIADLLDVGTGTGRMLEVFAPTVERAVGVDVSREMLGVARARLDASALANATVRQGDMYALPMPDEAFDAVVIHQVLHYAETPLAVIAEAARVLRPGGRVAIVDFAPHELEQLRAEHSHRRLGFSRDEVARWCADAGLDCYEVTDLPGGPLTVTIWLAVKPAEAQVRATVDNADASTILASDTEGTQT